MMVGALVLPVVSVGITEASITRKPVDAVHAQPRIDHRARVLAHLAGADRVIDRLAEPPRMPGKRRRSRFPGPGNVSPTLCRASAGAAKMRRVMRDAAQHRQLVARAPTGSWLDRRPLEAGRRSAP